MQFNKKYNSINIYIVPERWYCLVGTRSLL